MGLSDAFIKRMEKKLLDKMQEIVSSLDEIIDRTADTDSRGAQDEGDRSVSHYSLHYLSQLSTRELETFKAIEAALGKIKEGNFGVCEGCKDEINPKRIEAIPWAKYCVECQEKKEKGFL